MLIKIHLMLGSSISTLVIMPNCLYEQDASFELLSKLHRTASVGKWRHTQTIFRVFQVQQAKIDFKIRMKRERMEHSRNRLLQR